MKEMFVSSVGSPSLAANTAVGQHAGIYTHVLRPSFAAQNSFKQSSTPPRGLAVSETHIFAAQNDKHSVHVYSRARGHLEFHVARPEKILCVALAGEDVLIMGSESGRLMLWELTTGRDIAIPARHVQAITSLVTTPYHILTGSGDSDVHVWSLDLLLDPDQPVATQPDPERTMSRHGAAITGLVASPGVNPHTSLCVSASKDKSCIVWNYRTGDLLRTLLFPSAPSCLVLDPAMRALYVAADDGSLWRSDFLAERPLIGPHAEDPATVVQTLSAPLGTATADTGPALCIGVSHDGTTVLTGHAKGPVLQWDVTGGIPMTELVNLNAAVTNLVFLPPLPARKRVSAPTLTRPQGPLQRRPVQVQLEGHIGADTRFSSRLKTAGFSREQMDEAVAAHEERDRQRAGAVDAGSDSRDVEKLVDIVRRQQGLIHDTLLPHILAPTEMDRTDGGPRDV